MRNSRRLLHVLLFLLTFTLEVRVKAEEASSHLGGEAALLPLAHHVLEEPAGCLEHEPKSKPESSENMGACAVGTGSGERFEISSGKTRIQLDRSTTVIRESAYLFRLVKGQVWVQANGPFTVRTEFGDVKLNGRGEVWVSRTSDQVTASATETEVWLYPRGSGEALLVERGLENFMGRVGPSGRADTGLPVAIPFKEHVERWARLYAGGRKNFEIEVRRFHGAWLKSSETAAAVHQTLLERKIASLDEAQAKKEQARRKAEADRRHVNDLIRRRLQGEDLP